jgi:uncharacterized LabA/DUF88 family protein
LAEARLKIAVFIDFDNIEIGVKSTLGGHFDVGSVLEAIKERGEVVTKVAYGDWTRAGDYSRSLTQHAIHMVQRNLTPGGDKNGADINLALDALEMAFTHSHINTFVIVGGDSDFMALVEKLKQYDRKVIVVGGRAFTSHILQKNCHEFIAYENLVGRRPGTRGRVGQEASLTHALALIRRALKVLADREVSPQLGVLKSTLLQLDSTFSEREYGASTFRDLIQRLARAGHLSLKGSDRSIYVELRDGDGSLPATPSASREPEPADAQEPASEVQPATAGSATTPPVEAVPVEIPGGAAFADLAARPAGSTAAPAVSSANAAVSTANAARSATAPAPLIADPALQAEGVRLMEGAFLKSSGTHRWPLYLRQVKQVLRSADERFDERKYGFSGLVDALRYAQREGIFRLDRDRQGVLRVYPGPVLERVAPDAQQPEPAPVPPTDVVVADPVPETAVVQELFPEPVAEPVAEVSASAPEPAATIIEAEAAPVEAPAAKHPSAPRGRRVKKAASARKAITPRARTTASRPRQSTARKRSEPASS